MGKRKEEKKKRKEKAYRLEKKEKKEIYTKLKKSMMNSLFCTRNLSSSKNKVKSHSKT